MPSCAATRDQAVGPTPSCAASPSPCSHPATASLRGPLCPRVQPPVTRPKARRHRVPLRPRRAASPPLGPLCGRSALVCRLPWPWPASWPRGLGRAASRCLGPFPVPLASPCGRVWALLGRCGRRGACVAASCWPRVGFVSRSRAAFCGLCFGFGLVFCWTRTSCFRGVSLVWCCGFLWLVFFSIARFFLPFSLAFSCVLWYN